MKKLFTFTILIILLPAVTFISCEKQKEDPGKLLIGKWNHISTKAILYYDNVKISESTNTYTPGENVLEIYEDGTASRYSNGRITSSYYWSIEGDILLITWNTGIVQKTEYSVNDNALTLRWGVEETSDGHTTRSDYEGRYSRKL